MLIMSEFALELGVPLYAGGSVLAQEEWSCALLVTRAGVGRTQ